MIRRERKSSRLSNWDYAKEASYFITICCKDREHYFGKIHLGKMHVSPTGAIAHVVWFEIKNHVKNIELGEFVVMPNHVHGVLILKGDKKVEDNDSDGDGNGNRDGNGDRRDVACYVPTGNTPTVNVPMTNNPTQSEPESINPLKNERMAAISPKSKTVSSIIRSYKAAVTKYCNQLELPMAWQPRFHDHIIRNEDSYKRISEYIKNNPSNWQEDKFYLK
jgi:putative transposase